MDKYSKLYRIKIIQWNSQSLRPKLASFDALLKQEEIHVAIINETWLDSEQLLNISEYNIYRKDRMDSYGGVSIITHKSIQSQVCPVSINNLGIEILHVRLYNCKDLENIISIYCPSSVHTSLSDWDQIFSRFCKKTLVAGDFNGHHTNWSNKIDSRGTQILDSSLEYAFISLNNRDPTRLKLVNGIIQQSSPDVTFVSSDIATLFDWQVSNESLGSDHLIIKVSLKYHDQINIFKKRNFKLADWDKYRKYLLASFSDASSQLRSIEETYNYFIDQITKAADHSIPFYKICINPNNKFKSKAYWNPTLSQIVAQRRLALSTFRRNPTPENLCKLEQKVAEAQTLIKRAKSLHWQRFCDSINESTSSSSMWHRMQWIKGHKHVKVFGSDKKKEELLHNLAPDTVSDPKPMLTSENKLLESDFTMVELNNCLKKKDTAPGEDCVTYSMIFNLPFIAKRVLLDLYNSIYHSGQVPSPWRNIEIVPIPKARSTSESDVKLRPLSLMSCVCKIFHSMILKRLEWYIEKHNILPSYATGFRKGQSCLDSLVRLVSYIQIGMSKNNPTVACFLDIENAYNNVLVTKAVKILDEIQVGTKMCQYLWSFLSERYLKIKNQHGVASLTRCTNRGLAQGDPISPLLFNLVTHKICHHIEHVVISQYADDFVLYFSHEKIINCENNIQNALNCMIMALEELGLNISEVKSKICVFSRGRRKYQTKITINNIPLDIVDSVKYLGLWLDKRLLWNKHISEVQEKCTKFLSILRVLTGPTWGVHPVHLRRLYISLIRSRIDYGCFLYDSSAKSNIAKLDKIQNQVLRYIGGFIKSTPIHTMESEISIPPLKIRRRYLAFKYCLKALSVSNNMSTKLLGELNLLCQTRNWAHKKEPLLISTFNTIKPIHVHSFHPLQMFSLDIWVTGIQINNIIRTELEYITNAKSSYDSNLLKHEVVKEINVKYND